MLQVFGKPLDFINLQQFVRKHVFTEVNANPRAALEEDERKRSSQVIVSQP